ncbi:hypothetical protein GCM10023168_05800 [Fodinibacter luteus]|uniref:DUF8058 domain-containing protein n=1 Tax=Fodinibacter luteus TaxID=552064 RepID=A0ABP8K115_9MICO
MQVAVASYCLAVAALMGLWWGVEIRNGAVSRPDRSRGEIALHLAAESATVLLLAIGGIVLGGGGSRWVALVGLGMLLYTVIQSPGYFVARHELAPVVMFAVLALLTIGAIVATATL